MGSLVYNLIEEVASKKGARLTCLIGEYNLKCSVPLQEPVLFCLLRLQYTIRHYYEHIVWNHRFSVRIKRVIRLGGIRFYFNVFCNGCERTEQQWINNDNNNNIKKHNDWTMGQHEILTISTTKTTPDVETGVKCYPSGDWQYSTLCLITMSPTLTW